MFVQRFPHLPGLIPSETSSIRPQLDSFASVPETAGLGAQRDLQSPPRDSGAGARHTLPHSPERLRPNDLTEMLNLTKLANVTNQDLRISGGKDD